MVQHKIEFVQWEEWFISMIITIFQFDLTVVWIVIWKLSLWFYGVFWEWQIYLVQLTSKSLATRQQNISFEHIYREHNSMADKLSKQALESSEGILIWDEWKDNDILDQGEIYFFV